MPTYANLKSEYDDLWSRMVIRPDKAEAVSRIARRLIACKSRYQGVAAKTGVPWFVIAALHNRESDADFSTYLGNGDSLRHPTRHVPAGRGPFRSWEEGAIDALRHDGLDKVAPWSPARACYEIEKFNGWGYRLHHPHVRSPYLWSFSNHYRCGKYVADGRFDSDAVDGQCGAIPILRRIMELDAGARFSAAGRTAPVIIATTTAAGGAAAALAQNGYVKTAIAVATLAALVAAGCLIWRKLHS